MYHVVFPILKNSKNCLLSYLNTNKTNLILSNIYESTSLFKISVFFERFLSIENMINLSFSPLVPRIILTYDTLILKRTITDL